MKILILEGIPTSGKSTIAENIKVQLKGLSVRIVAETETHEPIMDKADDLQLSFFESLIRSLIAENPGLIIFDRLYLTQAFRAGANLTEYSGIETLLSQYGALTVYLRVSDHEIGKRIARAVEHRDSSDDNSFEWGDYFKTKGSSDDEIGEHYVAQQRNLLDLLGMSNLPHMVCDTTHHNYSEITQQILKKLQFK